MNSHLAIPPKPSPLPTGDGMMNRDRDGSFEPQLVKKNQTRITGMDNQILALYARGMTTREITSVLKKCTMSIRLSGADIESHRCRNRPGCRMAKPSSGCDLSHCLS